MSTSTIECKFASFWLMFEIFATSVFTIFVAGYVILGRHLYRKSIKGCTVLITNGNSKLSQEIARQMINDHKCKVILVFEPNVQLITNENAHKSFLFERTYQCNFLDHNQVKTLSDEISQNGGKIDILIENGRIPVSSEIPSIFSISPDRFIEETSNKIIVTLNLLIHFIPVLKHSTRRGHFVTIQSETSGARPFLETLTEIKELIRSLNVDASNMKPSTTNEVRLSTVVYNDNKSDNKIFKKLDLNLCEIAGTIIEGIQSEKHVVVVKIYYSPIANNQFKIFPYRLARDNCYKTFDTSLWKALQHITEKSDSYQFPVLM